MSVDSTPQPGGGDGTPRRAAAEPEGEKPPPGGRLPGCGDADADGSAEGRVSRFVRGVQNLFFIAVLLAMTVLGLLPILARFGVPVNASWADPLVRQMVLWLALFGAASATAGKKHISVDAVTHFLPRSLATGVRILTSLVAAAVSGVLAWVSVAFIRGEAEYAVAGSGILGAPEWCWQLVMPVGFSLLAVSLLLAAWREIRSLMPSKAGGSAA